MGLLAWGATLAALQDPANRLSEAVRRADPAAPEAALGEVARTGGPGAIRTIASALGRFRERPSALRAARREAAVRGLAGDRESVPKLVEILKDGDPRLREAAHRALEALTGVRLPPDAWVWRAGWSARGEGPGEAPAGPGVTAAFYELPVASSRVCFVIDRSLSMREGNRFETARRELKRLLGALPEGSRVHILFFGAGVSSVAGGLRPLDAQARRDATDFVDRQVPDARGTDLHGALEKALLLVGNPDSGVLRGEGTDTIVLLSDGLPTVGRVVDEELVARVAARRSRYLRPVFHAARLGAEAPRVRRLTERTGGWFLLLR